MADSTKNIVYNITINDKGKIKIDNLTKSFVNADNAVNKLNADLRAQQQVIAETTTKGLNPMIDKTGLAGATMVELGRTISDANYGIRGIANNLSQLSTLFVTLIATTGGLRNGLAALGKAFMGPLGIIVVFQIAIALLERFSMEQEKAKSKTDDLTKSIDNQIRSFSQLARAVDKYNLGGEALRDTVALLSSEFKEFDEAFQDLADNEFRLTIFETDVFGESIKTIYEGEEAIIKLTNVFKSLMETEREQILVNEKLRRIQSGERAKELLAQGDSLTMKTALIDTNKEEIELLGQLRESERKEIALRKILDDIKRVEGARDISDLEEKIKLTYDLKQAELELEEARVMDLDQEMLRDEFVSQFRQQSLLQRINAEEQAALAQLDAYEKDIDNFLFYQMSKADIQNYFSEERAKYMMKELEAFEIMTEGIARLFGEQSAVGKAFAVANATINTYLAASQVLKDELIPTPLKPVVMAGVIAAGLGNVREILKVDETGGGRLKGGGVRAANVEAPDFNIVGASPQSQLAQSVSSQQQKPLRAFVVYKDIKNAGDFDRNTISGPATFG